MPDQHVPGKHSHKRRFRFWSGRLIWILALTFLMQNAIASHAEYEPVAAAIFWAFVVLILFGGILFEILRSQKFSSADSEPDESKG